jgi:hypothetical protein
VKTPETPSLFPHDERRPAAPGPDTGPTWPCLSVRQPHAWGLIHGAKRIENRTWRTGYRGPLVIHAGVSRVDLGALDDYPGCEVARLAWGKLVGLVDLVDVVPFGRVRGRPYAEGPWCWVVANPRPVEPVAVRGRLQLFPVARSLVRPLPEPPHAHARPRAFDPTNPGFLPG